MTFSIRTQVTSAECMPVMPPRTIAPIVEALGLIGGDGGDPAEDREVLDPRAFAALDANADRPMGGVEDRLAVAGPLQRHAGRKLDAAGERPGRKLDSLPRLGIGQQLGQRHHFRRLSRPGRQQRRHDTQSASESRTPKPVPHHVGVSSGTSGNSRICRMDNRRRPPSAFLTILSLVRASASAVPTG